MKLLLLNCGHPEPFDTSLLLLGGVVLITPILSGWRDIPTARVTNCSTEVDKDKCDPQNYLFCSNNFG